MRAMPSKLDRRISSLRLGRPVRCKRFAKLAFAELGLDYQAHIDLDPGATQPSDIARCRTAAQLEAEGEVSPIL